MESRTINKIKKSKLSNRVFGLIIIIISIIIGCALGYYVFMNIKSDMVKDNIIESNIIVRNLDSSIINYEQENLGPVKQNKSPYEFTPELHEQGFLYEYAQTSLENDFNSFAAHMLMDYEPFWGAVKEYPRLKGKLDITRDFYIDVDKNFEPFLREQYEKYDVDW